MDYKALLIDNQRYLIPLLAALLSFVAGRSTVGTSPRSITCAADIEAVRVCQDLLSGHQQRCASAVSEAADSCVEAQTVVCEEKMNQLSATLRELDCAVCGAR